MNKVYSRGREALLAVSRTDFVTGSDLIPSITGHSIPRYETVAHILSIMPEVMPADTVMHVGGGSGYLAAVLSRLAHRVIYIEKNPSVAEAARDRFFRLGMNNVDVLAQSAESELDLDQPCNLVLCTTFMSEHDTLKQYLCEGGNLICLEGKAGPVPSMAMYVKRADKLERVRTLGWVDFNRNSEQILIDLGMVDERILTKAKAQAATENCRVLDVLRRTLNIEERELYRSLAQQRGMVFAEADALLPALKDELFQRFSRTFLDLSRIIPVAQTNEKVTFVTDDPDARTDQLERMSPDHTIECWLVTPTDFRRIWSALDLSAKGNRFAADQAVLSTTGAGSGNKLILRWVRKPVPIMSAPIWCRCTRRFYWMPSVKKPVIFILNSTVSG